MLVAGNIYKHVCTVGENLAINPQTWQAHRLFHSFGFQVFVAFLLLGNFGINAAEAQLLKDLTDSDGNPTYIQHRFDVLDLVFTSKYQRM